MPTPSIWGNAWSSAASIGLRHVTKPDLEYLAKVTDEHLRDWYREREPLLNGVETVVDASSGLDDTVKRVMRETGLDKVPAIDR